MLTLDIGRRLADNGRMYGAAVGVRKCAARGRSNCHLYHYAGNNPVRYIDPEGRLLKDQFISSGIEMIGGATETCAGYYVGNVFGIPYGMYNFIDGLIGVVLPVDDERWDGTTSLIIRSVLKNTNPPTEVKDMIVLSVECLDIFISDIYSSNLSDVGKMGQLTGNLAKIWNSMNEIACNYAEVSSLGSNLEVVQNFILYMQSLKSIEIDNDE